jgi:hypothetical protein
LWCWSVMAGRLFHPLELIRWKSKR